MPLWAVAGATLLVGGISAYEQNKGIGVQRGIANQQEYQSATIFGEQQGFENQLQMLLADPSSVTKLPGYAFNFDQGAEAVSRQMAAGGFLGSGNQMSALTKFGQDYAMSTFNQQANLLMQLSGITAASSPAQGGQVAAGAANNASNQLNNMLANLGILTGYGSSALAAKYGSAGGPPASSSGGGGGGGFGGVGAGQ